ncbi:hypothetical protein NDU88_004367 [Pleurodeles waltl]|uniref:Uncharacterized protein n=1 Tax=Pleurodeles waltl TaxID=8319 RepID=A0AAV7W8W2_PLEWA|nr:hypothetical protein NDU88_004367 [Pleurodeles waltl]
MDVSDTGRQTLEQRRTGLVPLWEKKREESRRPPRRGAWTAARPQRRSIAPGWTTKGVRKRAATEPSEHLETVEGYTGILPVEEELGGCEHKASDMAGALLR